MSDDKTKDKANVREAGPQQVAAAAVGTIIASMAADGETKLSGDLAKALKDEDWPRLLKLITPLYENLARKNRGRPT